MATENTENTEGKSGPRPLDAVPGWKAAEFALRATMENTEEERL